ncbi:MAG: flagellar protein [Ignavibacteriaceae bacterium]|jgi:flagellar operon protein|nr:flagellar protein [Ignavibacterium sp.]MCC6253447.1 flagellar protein [Ignavibacteriaceae bacterium]HMN22855.1 TIGR02530 family flagellar biosynthesis protein [Ignavibacteriaceae bacterium]HRN27001.1 TIGR02530 family flagellar biosynthesis protein [Ignavibacteriaceae bacterium]HRP91983.1 TIGR02530 family flagellar biosynthesis protein [Ignavibacteriaceae bacterium]
MPEINGISVPFVPIGDYNGNNPRVKSPADSFESIFQKELEKVKFSSHALKRLEERNIELSDSEMSKINTAIERAELKGSKDSLVMMNQTAFIVNIPNKTVITALPITDSSENVFTNIDSVVFAV